MLVLFPDVRQIRHNRFNNLKQALNVRLLDEPLIRLRYSFAVHRAHCSDGAVDDSLFRFDNAHVHLSSFEQMLSQLTS